MAHSCKRRLNGVGGADMLPVLCWEVVKSEQLIFVFGELFCRLRVFALVALRKVIE